MNRFDPWLDSAELRRLAESLAKPPRKPATEQDEAGFDDDFVGFVGESGLPESPAPVEIPTPVPFAAIPRATPSPVPAEPALGIPETTPAPAGKAAHPPPPLSHRQSPPAGKFQSFAQWMCQRYATTGIFIVDRQARVVFDQGHHDKMHFLAINVARNLQRMETTAAKVRIQVGGGTILEVIPVATANGHLVLGAMVTSPLGSSSTAEVSSALRQAADSSEPASSQPQPI